MRHGGCGNPAFDRKPALIVRCAGAADAVRAGGFAGGHKLLTAVHGGGHSLSGLSSCDGGIMIDVSPMRAVDVICSHARRASPPVHCSGNWTGKCKRSGWPPRPARSPIPGSRA